MSYSLKMLLNKMTQLTQQLAAYSAGLIVSFTLLYSSRRLLMSSLTWPHAREMTHRMMTGMMSTMRARAQEMETLAAAQKSQASTLSFTNFRCSSGCGLYHRK